MYLRVYIHLSHTVNLMWKNMLYVIRSGLYVINKYVTNDKNKFWK